jgi:hypothetical protein
MTHALMFRQVHADIALPHHWHQRQLHASDQGNEPYPSIQLKHHLKRSTVHPASAFWSFARALHRLFF